MINYADCRFFWSKHILAACWYNTMFGPPPTNMGRAPKSNNEDKEAWRELLLTFAGFFAICAAIRVGHGKV
ncbi:hypothetical protein B566_EDAN004844 [Ephemera danica]|nr:hypothetical protein B566_EDAN004844 [Ephemera danica]